MSYIDPLRESAGPMRYASFQHRLGAYALDILISSLTFGIGWLVWSFIAWGEGQTPGKKILKIRVRNFDTGAVATWGHMAVRELLVPITVAIAVILTSGLAALAWVILEVVFYYTKNNRTLRDYWVKTAVINEA
jgi:uncharacterized RDD family membrane protein YckC